MERLRLEQIADKSFKKFRRTRNIDDGVKAYWDALDAAEVYPGDNLDLYLQAVRTTIFLQKRDKENRYDWAAKTVINYILTGEASRTVDMEMSFYEKAARSAGFIVEKGPGEEEHRQLRIKANLKISSLAQQIGDQEKARKHYDFARTDSEKLSELTDGEEYFQDWYEIAKQGLLRLESSEAKTSSAIDMMRAAKRMYGKFGITGNLSEASRIVFDFMLDPKVTVKQKQVLTNDYNELSSSLSSSRRG